MNKKIQLDSMNTEEVIDIIRNIRIKIKSQHMCKSIDGECTPKDILEYRREFASLLRAEEALEKITPKKPNWVYNDEPLCPNCGEVLADGDAYCEECHQFIEWRNDDE